jgi:hypothetical protein
MWIAAPLTTIIVINQRKSNTRSHPNPSYARKFMTHRIAVSVEKSTVVSNDSKHRRRTAHQASAGLFPAI